MNLAFAMSFWSSSPLLCAHPSRDSRQSEMEHPTLTSTSAVTLCICGISTAGSCTCLLVRSEKPMPAQAFFAAAGHAAGGDMKFILNGKKKAKTLMNCLDFWNKCHNFSFAFRVSVSDFVSESFVLICGRAVGRTKTRRLQHILLLS